MLILSSLLILSVKGDLYQHNPRGSNNRLNEASANRQNANRCFDSQNNNRGGYNVGDLDDQNGFQNSGDNGNDIFDEMYNPNTAETRKQYNMMYMEGSMLRTTWTAQHGCGNPKNNCNMVMQWTCDTDDYRNDNWNQLKNKALGTRVQLRNGGSTATPDDPNNRNDVDDKYRQNNGNQAKCRQESEEYYYFAKKRERNKGLFTADQNLKGTTQIYTRQNPNGNRRGLEVPEERDYFPWHRPSPWHDIAWLGNDVEYCKNNIAPESMNVKEKFTCVGKNGNGSPDLDSLPEDDIISASDEDACLAADGVWTGKKWDGQPLDCKQVAFSQVNNLGNVDGSTLGGQTQNYMWKLPSVQELVDQGCHAYERGDEITDTDAALPGRFVRMLFRNRYNISTMDYDPYATNSTWNQDLKEGVISPITQNPTVDTGAHMQGLRLAINTAQTGRVFQDRSHVFIVQEQPAARNGNNAVAALQKEPDNLLNINVRGKRGNIVQTFPAVEYDFEPNDVTMQVDQCVHFQWTGSNTHNNGNPAGDGQAGDAGEGRGGSDRSNIAELASLRSSYPVPYDKVQDTFLDSSDCKWPLSNKAVQPEDAKVILASAGYYTQETGTDNHAIENRPQLDVLLNNVSASFRQGLVCCPREAGEYFLVSTRNNNFTNRSQKLHIVVEPKTAAAAIDKWDFFKTKM